jgi:hypothetical protein
MQSIPSTMNKFPKAIQFRKDLSSRLLHSLIFVSCGILQDIPLLVARQLRETLARDGVGVLLLPIPCLAIVH